LHVLLVQDDPAEAQAAMRALRASRAASEVHWVSDGQEALDYLFCSGRHAGRDPGEPPALVVLDIKLAKVDGIEVLRRMKGSHLKSILVVVTASSREEREVLESYRLGVDAYIVKPLAQEVVRDTVAKLGLG
jgi:DNA-binding response OmpR family regulator